MTALDTLSLRRGAKPPEVSRTLPPQAMRYALHGASRPPIGDAVVIGEVMRRAVQAQFGHASDGSFAAPLLFSGHDADGGAAKDGRHPHAFFLPEDRDGDGAIDHVTLYARDGITSAMRGSLAGLIRLWCGDRGAWELTLTKIGRGRAFDDSALFGFGRPQRRWISVTPYLMPWHSKKNFLAAEQIRREIAARGMLPASDCDAIAVEVVSSSACGQPLDHFIRRRLRPDVRQPDKTGCFVRLTLPCAIEGPVALGFGCHFGLGLFAADPQDVAAMPPR